jgi:hypothetical protein
MQSSNVGSVAPHPVSPATAVAGVSAVVRHGSTRNTDEFQAVAELHRAIEQADTSLVLLFCSSKRNLGRLQEAVAAEFACPVVGCTTAGEIDASGYAEGTIVGVSFSREAFTVYPTLIEPLHDFGAAAADQLVQSLAPACDQNAGKQRFGLLLVDGLSLQEEQLVAHLHNAFGNLPIVGGSAGDDLAFAKTHVLSDGRFVSGGAVFCLFETALPFRTFKTQHFIPTAHKLVITEAEPSARRVMEIDGMPASEAYADALGMSVDKLDPRVFSANPVILQMGGQCYVRSIQRAEPDGSLIFYCAIDTGLVLTIAKGMNLTENLQTSLTQLEQDVGPVALILGCDCILRRLEVADNGDLEKIANIVERYPLIGFSTYGEQYNGIHVNQTLTGVAIGAPR